MRARRVLTQKLNRDPLPHEIAKESGFDGQARQRAPRPRRGPVSLETPVGDGDSMYGDMLEDVNAEQPELVLGELLRGVELQVALEKLSDRMRHVLELRFGLAGETPKTSRKSAPSSASRASASASSSPARSASSRPRRRTFASTSAPSKRGGG
jgi:RNA polymerase primary sigma factor